MLADWRRTQREGLISARLAATLGVVECLMTGSPGDLPAVVAAAADAGVSLPALRSAGYINYGFNAINRIADALGAALPDAPDLRKSSRVLLTVGYRPLSGEFFGLIRSRPVSQPEQLLNDLRCTVVSGPGLLPGSVRASLFDAEGTTQLAAFARQVADGAWTVTDDDIRILREAGQLEDEIFEAAICSALGAATRRLDGLVDTMEALVWKGR